MFHQKHRVWAILLCSGFVSAPSIAHQQEKASFAEPVEQYDAGLLQSAAFKAGEKVYQTAGGYGCVACHGQYAHGGGNVGGNIRGHRLRQLEWALRHEPSMQLLAPTLSQQDKQDLESYLQGLGSLELIEWTIAEQPSAAKVVISKAGASQLVVSNKTFKPVEVTLQPLADGQTLTLSPYATGAFQWTAVPGIYRLQYQHNSLEIEVR